MGRHSRHLVDIAEIGFELKCRNLLVMAVQVITVIAVLGWIRILDFGLILCEEDAPLLFLILMAR